MHRDDIGFVILSPDGTVLTAKDRDGRNLPREALPDVQAAIQEKGLDPRAGYGVAQNDSKLPPPSNDVPWLPARRKRRRRSK